MHGETSFSIVIPAFNEADGLVQVLGELAHAVDDRCLEVLVVDDGSTDGTGTTAEGFTGSLPVRVIHHPVNRGYGAALKTGIRAALGEIVVTMDADGQHDPRDLAALIERTVDHDMVVGVRTRDSHRESSRRAGKWFINRLADFLTRTRIPDVNSGLRAFRRETILKYLHLLPDGFSASTTSTIALTKRGCAVAWVPITTRRRTGTSRVRQVRDGFGAILLMTRLITLFDPLRVFFPAGAGMFVAGLLSGVYYFFYGSYGGGVSTGSLLLLLTGLLLFFFGLLADQIAALRLERYE
ncbi:MAG: glycosyltransferase family 2 protein [Candidatus Latescibacteria bacterium]|nr:glycosyltransferase family 2 protein [Candidatus Latescibacterota bacterium]